MASKRWILAQLWHRKVACFCSRRPPLYISTRTRSSALTAGVSLSDLKDLALFWHRHVSAPAPLLLGLEPLTDLAKRLRAAHLALTLEPAESAELPRMC